MSEQIKDGGSAFPSHGAMGEVVHEGMTLRQYAAIKLHVPESGDDWLDEMIRKSLWDEFSAKTMQALITAAWSNPGPAQKRYHEWASKQAPDTNPNFYDWVANVSGDQADAMLRAREVKP